MRSSLLCALAAVTIALGVLLQLVTVAGGGYRGITMISLFLGIAGALMLYQLWGRGRQYKFVASLLALPTVFIVSETFRRNGWL